MHVQSFPLGELQGNAYLVLDEATKAAFVVDPGDEPSALVEHISELGVDLKAILLTHGHFDHIAGVGEVHHAFNAPVYLHKADVPLYGGIVEQAILFGLSAYPQPPVDRELEGGETLEIGPFRIDVIHTPGHTPGGVSYKIGDAVFVGDTIFGGGIGRTDLPGGSHEQLLESIRQRILTLDDSVTLYPGHGPPTTVGAERTSNPFLA